jgi:hypothetical protein
MYQNKIKIKEASIVVTIFLSIFYFFGILGNYRTTTENNDNLFEIGKPTEAFKQSVIPKEFFWSYIYMASPLANFQETVNNNPKLNNKWAEFSVYELLPNFISKRVDKHIDLKNEKIDQISPSLTVGTLYSGGFKFLGWLGPILMYIYVIIIVSLYWFFIDKNNPFYITGLSLLGVFMIFNFFTNMISSGLSLQLCYPILFQIIKKNKRK